MAFKTKEFLAHCESNGWTLVETKNGGTWNIRRTGGTVSYNIGKPKNNRWEDGKVRSACRKAGIPMPS